jgi:hypothetical protein
MVDEENWVDVSTSKPCRPTFTLKWEKVSAIAVGRVNYVIGSIVLKDKFLKERKKLKTWP